MAIKTSRALASAVIYEIFVRNHGNGGFVAVNRDLPRIKELGTDIIWLMPIYPIGQLRRNGSLGSPYAIQNYTGINPELGDQAALQQLIAECHRLGMSIIIDIVFNHTSPDSKLVKCHPEWFLCNKQGQPIPKFPEWADIVDLRYVDFHGHPRTELWDEQIASLQYWVDLGFDGFRCDVASVVPPAFWRRAHTELHRPSAFQSRGELIWLAETAHKSFIKLMRDQGYGAWSDAEILDVFDLSYDHDGLEYLDEYFAGKRGLGSYLDHLLVQETMNPAGSLKLRFVENHDIPRAGDRIRGTERLKAWTTFQAMLPGAFLVYAGQEYRAIHKPGLFDLDPIDLSPSSASQTDFKDFLRQILSISKQIKSNCQDFSIIEVANGVVCLRWTNRCPEQPLAYTAILNLEDRFGEFNPGREIEGINLLDRVSVCLQNGSRIPKEIMIIQETATAPAGGRS